MSSKLPSAIYGAVAAVVLATLFQLLQIHVHNNFGILFCLSYLVCGLVAVWHYTGEYSVTLPGKDGVLLGTLSGAFAAFLGHLLGYLLMVLNVLPDKEEAIEGTIAQLHASGNASEEAIQGTIQYMEFIYGMEGLLAFSALFVLFGLIGGAVGRAIWKRGEDQETKV